MERVRSASHSERIGPLSSNNLWKLAPMFAAPFLSLFSGTKLQSRCVQRRSPRIFLSIAVSFSSHGPQGPKHVFEVYASGVGATTNRLESLRIRPTPMHGGLPRLHAAPALPATSPQEP